MFVMCAENVESDCSMLCSSPISASTWRNTAISLPSAAGIIRPHIAISVRRPAVLSDTVLPPVFGPVTISASNSCPSSRSVGTTLFLSISGWRAALMQTRPASFSFGTTAFIL